MGPRQRGQLDTLGRGNLEAREGKPEFQECCSREMEILSVKEKGLAGCTEAIFKPWKGSSGKVTRLWAPTGRTRIRR